MNFEKYEGQTHVRLNSASVMRERVVIKWGGGLITDKSKLCTPNLSALQKLAEAVSSCCKQGFDAVSYTHLTLPTKA